MNRSLKINVWKLTSYRKNVMDLICVKKIREVTGQYNKHANNIVDKDGILTIIDFDIMDRW